MPENKDKNKIGMWQLIVKHKFHFFLDVFIVFLITFGVLYLFGFVPNEFNNTIGRYPAQESKGNAIGELPLTLTAPEVGINTQVYNPDSTSTDVLDSWLTKGAVRYPGSGLPGGTGNVYIFGHSTGFKVVHNQAYKTFVGLDKLQPGDPVYVDSADYQYTYKVQWVKMETADEALVVFNTNENLLTLSTCDTFASKEDRYVMQAQYVGREPIPATLQS